MNYRETMSRLNKAIITIDSAYAQIAKQHGLTFNALMMLCSIDETDNITQKQLCDALQLPKSTVHSILQDFIKKGYVALIAGSNKKEKCIAFTETGRQYFQDILIQTHSFENRILSALGVDTCSFLVETAEKLGDIINDEFGN